MSSMCCRCHSASKTSRASAHPARSWAGDAVRCTRVGSGEGLEARDGVQPHSRTLRAHEIRSQNQEMIPWARLEICRLAGSGGSLPTGLGF